MKKVHYLILASLLFTPVGKLAAQTFQGDVATSISTFVSIPNELEASAPAPAGAVTMQFTIDPVALTFQFDSLAIKNLTLPTITTTYPLGFGSGSQANVTISFNPLNFVLRAPPSSSPFAQNPVPLVSLSGTSPTTYQSSFSIGTPPPSSGITLAGSYSISSSTGSDSGTFSEPLTFDSFLFSANIQTTGYPNAVSLFGGGGYDFRPSQAGTTLFTANLDGTTISPKFDQFQQVIAPGIGYTTFSAVPEPSSQALGLFACGLFGALICRRQLRLHN